MTISTHRTPPTCRGRLVPASISSVAKSNGRSRFCRGISATPNRSDTAADRRTRRLAPRNGRRANAPNDVRLALTARNPRMIHSAKATTTPTPGWGRLVSPTAQLGCARSRCRYSATSTRSAHTSGDGRHWTLNGDSDFPNTLPPLARGWPRRTFAGCV
jgi:hypothetical protein